ncbi:MAG: 3-deoxy-D-manno-octulosonic acid transferase [Deltaproteobacteria bacterium]|nr:3-deoxy-D-manno-octulosonic acid transferase [Deltaproteobacteria bacterium]
MRFLYSALSYVAHGALAPLFLGHPKLRDGVRQRLGLEHGPALDEGLRVWFHGASAGDLLALRPTITALRQLEPRVVPMLSTITNSGRAMGEREFKDVPLRYAPYDMPFSARRALEEVRPKILVLEYTELWPNFISAAKKAGAKVVLHNGRFSAKNLANYKLLFRAIGNVLDDLDLLLMRDEEEAARAIELGAHIDRVHVTGNTKFDNLREPGPAPESLRKVVDALGWQKDDMVWVWGSTHEGEEEKLLDGYRRLKTRWPRLKLIVAPRYVERAKKVRELLHGCLRTNPQRGADVLVIDTIGELFDWYGAGTLVFIGGSFVSRGGQNILEPAAHGKPVTFGPHMQNFADSVQVLLGRGGTQVKDPEQLFRVTQELLERPDEIQKLGALAHDAVMSVKGAAKRNAAHLAELLR